MLNFVDYATLQMLAIVVAIANIFWYGWTRKRVEGVEKVAPLDEVFEKHRTEGIPFLFTGLLLSGLGYSMVTNWPLAATEPLTGNANIVIGWPSLYFGLLFLFAGGVIVLARGEARIGLQPLCRLAVFGGIMNIFLALAILTWGVGTPPPARMWSFVPFFPHQPGQLLFYVVRQPPSSALLPYVRSG